MAQNTVTVVSNGGLLQINDNLDQPISYDRFDLRLTRENQNDHIHEIVTLRKYSDGEFFFSLNTLDLRDGGGASFANKTLAIAYLEGLLGSTPPSSGISLNSSSITIGAGATVNCNDTFPGYVTVDGGILSTLNLVNPWSGIVDNVGSQPLIVQGDGNALSPPLELAPGEAAMVTYNDTSQAWSYTILNREPQIPVLESSAFTPAMTDLTGAINSFSQLEGYYQRIDSIVNVTISGSAQASGSGPMVFASNLPVPDGAAVSHGIAVVQNTSTSANSSFPVEGTGQAGVATDLSAAATYDFKIVFSYFLP